MVRRAAKATMRIYAVTVASHTLSEKRVSNGIVANGFTLVELMITLFIIGMIAGAVVMTLPGDEAAMAEDADRFAARVAAARDEAIIGSRPVAVWVAPSGYGFEQRRDGQWLLMTGRGFDDMNWRQGTVARLVGNTADEDSDAEGPARSRFTFDATGLPSAPVSILLSRGEDEGEVKVSTVGEVSRAR